MGVALPELPDDRRAQPRRYNPAESPVSARHAADSSPEGGPRVPGRPIPSTPWTVDGHAANGAQPAPVHPRDLTSPSGQQAPAPPTAPVNGRHANGAVPGGRHSGAAAQDGSAQGGGPAANGRHAGSGHAALDGPPSTGNGSGARSRNGRARLRAENRADDVAGGAAMNGATAHETGTVGTGPSAPTPYRPGPVAPAANGPTPYTAALDGPTQIVPVHNAAFQSGALQKGAPQTGAFQNGAPQTGAPQAGALQNGAPQTGAFQTGAPQTGALQTGASQTGASQTGALPNGAPQNGAPQNGALQNGAASSGIPRNRAQWPDPAHSDPAHNDPAQPDPAQYGAARGESTRNRSVSRGSAPPEPPRSGPAVHAADLRPPVAGSPLPVPQRRPDPDEAPTVVVGRPVDASDPDEAPGRHRRRAGGSPEGLPTSSYQGGATGGRKAKPGRRRRPAFWKELPLLVVVALVLTFLIQTFLAKVYVIPSGSMETTLHGCTGCNNDRVLVDKVTYRFSDPRPGDVVVFRGPDSWNSEFTADPPSNVVVQAMQTLGSLIGLAPPDEKDFDKRVIAVGGQTVQCCDSRNRVVVDGKPLDEPYIYYLPEAGQARQDVFNAVTVPPGELWMMGDSRNNSADSRVPGHGPVPVANVIGKARLIVLPFSRFGTIPDPNPQSTALGMAAPGAGTAPLALSLVGAVPLMLGRRRIDRLGSGMDEFLPRSRRRRR